MEYSITPIILFDIPQKVKSKNENIVNANNKIYEKRKITSIYMGKKIYS